MEYIPSILVAYAAYAVGTASPGPATLAIMQVSASVGRREGLKFAFGVIMGSFVWGVFAALGFATLMVNFAWLFMAMKIAGGLYLLWLAFKSFRSALSDTAVTPLKVSSTRYFAQGLALHLTNPKAIFVWAAIIALGLPQGAPAWVSGAILIGCALIGVLVFSGFALLFSTQAATGIYSRFRRRVEAVAAALFGVAGLSLLSDLSKSVKQSS